LSGDPSFHLTFLRTLRLWQREQPRDTAKLSPDLTDQFMLESALRLFPPGEGRSDFFSAISGSWHSRQI